MTAATSSGERGSRASASQSTDALPHDGLPVDLETLSMPTALAPALKQMLEPDPKQRVASVAEVRRLLDEPTLPPGGSRWGPSPKPSGAAPSNLPAVPSEAEPLVPVDELRQLARVPAPLSILVWLFTAIGAGSVTVFQVLMMPLVFRLARHFSRKEPADKRAALETNLARFERTVVQTRRSLAFVAGKTHPIRDDDDQSKAIEGPRERASKGRRTRRGKRKR